MTQTPEDPQLQPETPSSVDLPNHEINSLTSDLDLVTPVVASSMAPDETPVVAAPIPTPTYVYAPPVTFSEQSAGAASPAVKKAIIAGVISGLVAGMIGFMGASMIGNTPAPSISLPASSGDTSPRADDSIAGIAQAVLPVVVSIDVSSNQGSGTGSGFVIRSTAKESFILTNISCCRKSVHLWHLNVHEHTVIRILFHLIPALSSVARKVGLNTHVAQELNGKFKVNVVVFHQQNL